MTDVALNSAPAAGERANPPRAAIVACMLAGMCTFLNVYDTQPLLPYLQRLYNTSEIAVSLTVSCDDSGDGADGAVRRLAGGVHRTQEGHRSVAVRADRSDAAGRNFAEPAAS